jgi:hypothetical protein
MLQLGLASKPKTSAAGQAGGVQKQSVAAAALAAAKAAASVAGASRAGTVTVVEQRRFAGQTITVNKEVARDSKEAQQAEADAAAAAKKKAGLDAVLASLQQAKKVGRRVAAGLPASTVCILTGTLQVTAKRCSAGCSRAPTQRHHVCACVCVCVCR